MKPRPVPTSPKQSSQRDPIETLYQSQRIEKPKRTPYAMIIVISILLATGLTLLLLAGAVRYPNTPILRFLVQHINTNSPQASIQPNGKQVVPGDIGESTRVSIGMLLQKKGTGTVDPSDRYGYAVFLTSDGVGVTLRGTIPHQAQVSVRASDGSVASLSKSENDPATIYTFIRSDAKTRAIQLADPTSYKIGQELWAVRNDPYADGVSVMKTSIISLHSTVMDITDAASLIESSDVEDHALLLDGSYDTSWKGTAVVDDHGKFVGLLQVKNAVGSVMPIGKIRDALLTSFASGTGVLRPSLGVHYIDLSYSIIAGTTVQKGALLTGNDARRVKAVAQNSDAAKSGLKLGDRIVAVDGTPLDDRWSLQDAVLNSSPNSKLVLTVDRNGQEHDATVTLDTMERAL